MAQYLLELSANELSFLKHQLLNLIESIVPGGVDIDPPDNLTYMSLDCMNDEDERAEAEKAQAILQKIDKKMLIGL